MKDNPHHRHSPNGTRSTLGLQRPTLRPGASSQPRATAPKLEWSEEDLVQKFPTLARPPTKAKEAERIRLARSPTGQAGFRFIGDYVASAIEALTAQPHYETRSIERDPISGAIKIEVLISANTPYTAYHSMIALATTLSSHGKVESLF